MWARLISPGRGITPPRPPVAPERHEVVKDRLHQHVDPLSWQASATSDAVWWGARNGGVATSPPPGGSSPATE